MRGAAAHDNKITLRIAVTRPFGNSKRKPGRPTIQGLDPDPGQGVVIVARARSGSQWARIEVISPSSLTV